MEILDINGKKREVVSIRVVTEQIPDRVNGGIANTQKFVEVVIKGKSGRTWKEWYPIEEFKKFNPKVNIDA